jgi:F-type H+-transporting ATPase subunit alpha
MSFELVEQLKKALEKNSYSPEWESAGTIIEVGDGVARAAGLSGAQSQEILLIDGQNGTIPALALNLEEDSIGVLILGSDALVRAGDTVRLTGTVLSVPVGPELLGRVIDPLGNPVDGQGDVFAKNHSQRNPLERPAPSVLAREPVSVPLSTGITAIDAMIPIGRGQRQLIIGDRQTGKTAIAIDAIINQTKSAGENPVVSVYVAIGQKESKIARLVETLRHEDALKNSIIIAAGASAPAAFSYLAPFAGTAIAEYFMDQGRDVLVVYDDLSKHANAYRQISLLLRRPPGREAYPGDVFYLHSRLLERASRLSTASGGGSITALPIIETQLGDISAYIPTNVISITDGQIFLETDLFNKGIRPAINAGLSVSRVGSAAQTKAMKKVSGTLRLALAQFRELQAFVQFASDVDAVTAQKIKRGELLTEMLKQNDLSPLSLAQQVSLIYAATNGYLDSVALSHIPETVDRLLRYLESVGEESVIKPLTAVSDLTPDVERALTKCLTDFFSTPSA